jgi:hypothetical protein
LTTVIFRDANFETVDGMATPIDVVPWPEGTIGARQHQRSRVDHATLEGDATEDALLHEGDEVRSQVGSRCACYAATDRTDGNGEVAAKVDIAIDDLLGSALIANDEHDLTSLGADLQSKRALTGEIGGSFVPLWTGRN